MRSERINNLTKEQIADFCVKNHIRKFAFFGSVIREDFSPGSDVDILVEYDPEAHIGLMEVARMRRMLSEIIGREVDLRTPKELSRYFRDEVMAEAEVYYAED